MEYKVNYPDPVPTTVDLLDLSTGEAKALILLGYRGLYNGDPLVNRLLALSNELGFNHRKAHETLGEALGSHGIDRF